MKRLFLTMLAMAALTSCTDIKTSDTESISTPIKFSANVTPTTKTVITDESTFEAGIAGSEHTTTANYETPTWSTSANIVKDAVTLPTVQYYSADASIKTFIKSWYPKGTFANGVVTFTDPTGTEDIMITDEISGEKTTNKDTPLALTFKHKTTQFKFEVVSDVSFGSTATLTSIKIKNAQLPKSLNLVDGTVTFDTAAELPVPNISTPTITTIAAVVGNPVMISPISTNKFTVDVVTSAGTFSGIEITTTDTTFEEAKAYTVTLTFKKQSISGSAAIAAWTIGTATGTVI